MGYQDFLVAHLDLGMASIPPMTVRVRQRDMGATACQRPAG